MAAVCIAMVLVFWKGPFLVERLHPFYVHSTSSTTIEHIKTSQLETFSNTTILLNSSLKPHINLIHLINCLISTSTSRNETPSLFQLKNHTSSFSSSSKNMPRGAEYDNGIPQSDNAIEDGPTKAHGTNPGSDINRAHKAADLPEVTGGNNLASGGGTQGRTASGSGKGGHEPKTLGERKGLGTRGSRQDED